MPNIYPSLGYIYRITNTINGKVYIGKTEKEPEIRFKQHKKSKSNCLLHKAIRKYSIKSFLFDIIFIIFDKNYSNEYEKMFIEEYDCCVIDDNENGYNMTRGGDGGRNEFAIQKLLLLSSQGNHPSQRPGRSELQSNLVKSMIENGTHAFNGKRGSELQLKINQDKVKNGTHQFQGERGSIIQKRRIDNGTHPFSGENGSLLSKKTASERIESGNHNFQGEQGRKLQIDRVNSGKHNLQGNAGKELHQKRINDGTHNCLIYHKCPHCGKEGKGSVMFRYHFNKCKLFTLPFQDVCQLRDENEA